MANDLAPLGYDCTIFEALDTTGGLMRTNIPRFRLPPDVLDEEIGYILESQSCRCQPRWMPHDWQKHGEAQFFYTDGRPCPAWHSHESEWGRIQ